MKVIPEIRRAQ